MNRTALPGWRFELSDDLILRQLLVDKEAALAFYKSIGMSESASHYQFDLAGSEDFSPVNNIISTVKSAYVKLFPECGPRIKDVPVTMAFQSFIHAGARKVDGKYFVTVSATINRVVAFTQLTTAILRFSQKHHCSSNIGNLPSEDIADAVRSVAVDALGLEPPFPMERYWKSRATLFELAKLPEVRDAAAECREWSGRSCDWAASIIFVLAHEFGHIVLNHFEELDEWINNPAQTTEEEDRRFARRREMEHDADAHAARVTTLIQANVLGKSYKEAVEMWREPEFPTRIVRPICNLFTIFSIAQDHIYDFAASHSEYPPNGDRLLTALAAITPVMKVITACTDYTNTWARMEFSKESWETLLWAYGEMRSIDGVMMRDGKYYTLEDGEYKLIGDPSA